MDRYRKFIEEKAKHKRKIFGAQFHPRTPVLLVDLSGNEELDEVRGMLEGAEKIQLHTIVVFKNSGAVVEKVNGKYIRYIESAEKKQAFHAADFALVTTMTEWREALERDCVPVGPQDGELTTNYNPLQEEGNGFYFVHPTQWEMFAAVVRAKETYQFPYDWENLVKEVLNSKN